MPLYGIITGSLSADYSCARSGVYNKLLGLNQAQKSPFSEIIIFYIVGTGQHILKTSKTNLPALMLMNFTSETTQI